MQRVFSFVSSNPFVFPGIHLFINVGKEFILSSIYMIGQSPSNKKVSSVVHVNNFICRALSITDKFKLASR